MHCGPVGEDGTGDKVTPYIVAGVVNERFEERKEGSVCVLSFSVALRVVGSYAGYVRAHGDQSALMRWLSKLKPWPEWIAFGEPQIHTQFL